MKEIFSSQIISEVENRGSLTYVNSMPRVAGKWGSQSSDNFLGTQAENYVQLLP